MSDYRTPLSKARGLGSAKSGVGHYISIRVAAVALVLLIPAFIYAIVTLPSGDYETARGFVASPLGALLMLATLTAALYHMRLGMQVVIEDYISKPGTKSLLLIANTLIAGAAWLAVLYSTLRLAA